MDEAIPAEGPAFHEDLARYRALAAVGVGERFA
jgi:hypothetical protein